MEVFSQKSLIKEYLKTSRIAGKRIGFVPTMGALHSGHISLINKSKAENDLTVCSIFVNPTQFNDKKDFDNYPQPLLRDQTALIKAGCDVLFLPDVSDMYPQGIDNLYVSISFGQLDKVLEGKHRPGHFNGVALIVSKLLHIISPTVAYFGQKDYQQYLIIEKLIQELDFDVKIEMVETVRDPDGLAFSSRNERLSLSERTVAPILYQALLIAKNSWNSSLNSERAKAEANVLLKKYPEIELEYLEIVDAKTLNTLVINDSSRKALICIAAKIGETRLIDNLLV